MPGWNLSLANSSFPHQNRQLVDLALDVVRLPYPVPSRKDLFVRLAHVLTSIAKLLGPGGVKAVVADSLLMKQQRLGTPKKGPLPS